MLRLDARTGHDPCCARTNLRRSSARLASVRTRGSLYRTYEWCRLARRRERDHADNNSVTRNRLETDTRPILARTLLEHY